MKELLDNNEMAKMSLAEAEGGDKADRKELVRAWKQDRETLIKQGYMKRPIEDQKLKAAAEMHDEVLFKPHPQQEDCVIW
jgi:hypothetical protein